MTTGSESESVRGSETDPVWGTHGPDFFSVVSLYSRHPDVVVELVREATTRIVQVRCRDSVRSVLVFDSDAGVRVRVAPDAFEWRPWGDCQRGDAAFDAVSQSNVILSWLRGRGGTSLETTLRVGLPESARKVTRGLSRLPSLPD